jgi:predicted nucleic acid-binding Zn ribbon protein
MGNSARNFPYAEGNVVRRKSPEKAQKILTLALKKFGIDKDIARYKFVLHWREIVGDDVAERSRPECFRNGALVVRVSSSTWAQELSFQKDAILRRLKAFVGSEMEVNDVQFYVADLK